MENNSRIDLMLDIETLGKYTAPVMIQLSAVPFNRKTGETYPEHFNEFISPQSSVKAGLETDGSTFNWWLTQDDETIKKVVVKAMLDGKDVRLVMESFNEYVKMLKKKYKVKTVKVFVNGCLDWPTIRANCYKLNMEEPVPFWDVNDFRGNVDQCLDNYGFDPKKTIPFTGEKHNAIDDCLHQIKYLVAIWNHKG